MWTVAIVLFLMWLAGMISSHTLNGFIHILLILAIITILIRIIQGNKPLP